MMAATVFGHCRSNSSWVSAPRQSVLRPVDAEVAVVDGAGTGRIGEAVEGVEVVEQVHADDAHVTTDVLGVRGPRVDGREVDAAAEGVQRPHPVGVGAGRGATPGVGHDADRVGRGVTTAQGVLGAERLAAPAEHDRVGVLRLRGVVDEDLVEVVLRLHRDGRGTGLDDVGRLLQASPGGEQHLAEPAELEVLGDGQGLRHPHDHALVALERRGAGHRQGHVGRGDRAGAALDDVGGGHRDLGLALVLSDVAGDRDDVTELDEVLVAAVEHEDRVGGGRVAVTGGVLQVEATQGGARDPRSRRRRRPGWSRVPGRAAVSPEPWSCGMGV